MVVLGKWCLPCNLVLSLIRRLVICTVIRDMPLSLVEMLVNGPSLNLSITTQLKHEYSDTVPTLPYSTVEDRPCRLSA